MGMLKAKQVYTPTPPPPEPAPPPPNAPTTADASVQAAGAAGRAQTGVYGSRASGLAGTIMTSPQGLLDNANTTKKSLLGQ